MRVDIYVDKDDSLDIPDWQYGDNFRFEINPKAGLSRVEITLTPPHLAQLLTAMHQHLAKKGEG